MSKIVIGHRMGKGNNVAEGLEKQGHEVIVISGMLADMKLGSIMDENSADFGISFCGSGGAGAISAENEYGYKGTSGLRTVQEGVAAVKDGYKVVGFGFMDTVELGTALGEALNNVKK